MSLILNNARRETLCQQLLQALLPARDDEHNALSQAAFSAVVLDFYGAKGMRRIAGLPGSWLTEVRDLYVYPTGEKLRRVVRGTPRLLPRKPPEDHALGTEAQAAVDLWFGAVETYRRERSALKFRLDVLLLSCRTLDSFLRQLPEARDVLQLPAEETPEAIAESVRSQLAQRPSQ